MYRVRTNLGNFYFSGDTLVGYFRRRAQSKSYLSSELRCIQHIHTSGRKDEQQAVMVGFTTYDWWVIIENNLL